MLKPPTGTIDAASFAERICSRRRVYSAYYDGQRVVLDGDGHAMTYSGNAVGEPLRATIYGQISQVS